MAPEPILNLTATLLFIGSSAANAWAARQRRLEAQRVDVLRGRALEILDRLRKEGRGLREATPEELGKIHEALEA
jgi:hypothetical protein